MLRNPIFWAGRFFVGCSSVGETDGATQSAVSVTPCGTLWMFYCLLCLILYSCVSTVDLLVIPHIWFSTHPHTHWLFMCASLLLSLLSRPSAPFLILLSQPRRVYAPISIDTLIHRPCHLVCLITLSLLTYASPAVLIHRRFHHPKSLPPHPYCYSSLPPLWFLCLYYPTSMLLSRSLPATQLCPHSLSYWRTQLRILGTTFRSVGHFHSDSGNVVVIPVGQQAAIKLGCQCYSFGRPRYLQSYVFLFGDATFLFWGVQSLFRIGCVPTPLFIDRCCFHWDGSPELINSVPVRRTFMLLVVVI